MNNEKDTDRLVCCDSIKPSHGVRSVAGPGKTQVTAPCLLKYQIITSPLFLYHYCICGSLYKKIFIFFMFDVHTDLIFGRDGDDNVGH